MREVCLLRCGSQLPDQKDRQPRRTEMWEREGQSHLRTAGGGKADRPRGSRAALRMM